MALIVGTDTYITLADANTYLTGRYLSNDQKLTAWNAMQDSDNEVLLRQAQQLIDRLPLQGYKRNTTQALQFPRTLYTKGIRWSGAITQIYGDENPTTFNNNWYTQTSIPLDVAQAQCEIAIDLVNGENKRAKLQREGVKSFSVGGLSETYSGSVKAITSTTARELLAQYTGGGFAIC